MKEISEIQRLVETYYHQAQDKNFLLDSLDFTSSMDRGIALAIFKKKNPDLVTTEEIFKAFQNSKEWKNLQEDFTALMTILEEFPEFIQIIDANKVVGSFVGFVANDSTTTDFGFKDLLNLESQLSEKYLLHFEKFVGGKLSRSILMHQNGNSELLKQIVNNYAEDLEYLVMEVEDVCKKLKIPPFDIKSLKVTQNVADLVLFKMLDQLPVRIQNEKAAWSGRFDELYKVFKSSLLRPHEEIVNHYEYLSLNTNKEIVQEMVLEARLLQVENSHWQEFERTLVLPVKVDTSALLKLAWSVGGVELASILVKNKLATIEQVYESLFSFAKNFSDAHLFIQYCERLSKQDSQFKINYEMNGIKKIALSLNVARQNNLKSYSFDAIVYEFLVKELSLSSFQKGNLSFQSWYPEMYLDILEMESFKTFYDQEQFLVFFKKDLSTPEQEQVVLLKQALDICVKKTGEILKILNRDIASETHSVTGKEMSVEDLKVLSGFSKKLNETHDFVVKIQQKFSQDKNIQDLFLTDKYAYSMANLKGNHFGELKAAGMDNFQGSSQQLSEIFKAFDFLIQPHIQKEVDHFFYVKNDNFIDLRLVETKNYTKMVTERNKRIADIKFQKNKLDESLSEALTNTPGQVQVKTQAELVLLKGLTENAYHNLQTAQSAYSPYDVIQGIVYSNDNFTSNLSDLSSKMNRQSRLVQIEGDLENFFEILRLMKQDGVSNPEIVSQVKKMYDKLREVPGKELDLIKRKLQDLSGTL